MFGKEIACKGRRLSCFKQNTLLVESSKNFITFGFVFPNVFIVILDRLDFFFFFLPMSGCFFVLSYLFLK